MITIGVDESGTGAFAGPFTVCAYALDHDDEPELQKLRVRDSKGMSDAERRSVFVDVAGIALATRVLDVSVREIRQIGQGPCWAGACASSIYQVWFELTQDYGIGKGDIRVVVDGSVHHGLRDALRHRIPGSGISFVVKADQTYRSVSAASVLAKTIRNDLMLELHREFPQYMWSKNMGYGTPQHRLAIEEYGLTPQHRPIRSLAGSVR